MKQTTMLLLLAAASAFGATIDISTGQQATSEGYVEPSGILVPGRRERAC